MMRRVFTALNLGGWLLLHASLPVLLADEPRSSASQVSFSQQIAPLFRSHCQGCHQPAKAQGELVMTEIASLYAAGESGMPAVVPGKPDESYLIEQIVPHQGEAAMPKGDQPLAESDIDLIRRWIAEGAVDDSPPATPSYSANNPPQYQRPPLITALAYSSDGKWLAVSGFQEVLLLDATTQQLEHRLVGLSERIESISFSPDSRRLAVTGGSPGRLGEVQVWDVPSGELLLSKQITFDTVYGGCFSPDGKLVAFGCSDNTVRAIDAESGAQVLHQGAHDDWILACVFSPDGKHLVSAGRDMTVKLTEVETERFVDNITSITPGALRGGINALAMHPSRHEVLVGGSDGAPKVYRLYRETERRIGDDANLIRQFPTQQGRIFGAAIDPQGRHLATVSTLDGNSQVLVYPYDFDGNLPDNVKAAMAKRIADRNDEERKLISEYTSQTAEARFKLDVSEVSIYAVAFTPDGERLAFGGSDGLVHVLGLDKGEVSDKFCPVPLSDDTHSAQSHTHLASARGIPPTSDAVPDPKLELQQLPNAELIELNVAPQRVQLLSLRESVQLVVSAVFANGSIVDVTRLVNIEHSEQIEVSANGLVRPSASGKGELIASLLGKRVSVPVTVSDLTTLPAVDFITDVNPLLSRLGCNSGTCHGAQKGKNGFKLSLRGYDPLEDVRALSDDLGSRRLNTAAPDASLMLLKPLGSVPHEGGVLLSRDSVYYEVLRGWIAEGAELNPDSSKVARIELYPENPVIGREQSWQQFRVLAHFPDGRTRDVTHEAFIESGNGEIAKSHEGGRVQALRRGEAPILARYEGAYAAATVTVMGDRSGFVWREPPANNTIDQLVSTKWERMKLLPSELCSDAEFLRRVRLDLTGLPPTSAELKEFLSDPRPSTLKRRQVIDQLLVSPDYVEHWSNKWADLLQVNSKFIGSEGASAFRDWIRKAIATNQPYDEFAHSVLTASGSNRDNPAASYYKILREPDAIMENTTHLFLAIRFNCNKCHDHPFERWTQDQYYELAAFFAQTELKEDPTSQGKKIGGTAVEGAKPLYEEVYDSQAGEVTHERTGKAVAPAFPFECDFEISPEASRREQLAAWITSADNPYFAKSYVNRLWGYMTGTGLMEPLDDIRAGNPPTNPELLEHLTREFVESDFDVRHVIRLICNSRTYQLSVATHEWNEGDQLNYSHATARRLPAEVLYDAVHRVTGAVSGIPGVAPGTRAAALPDVAVNLPDGFLNNLGRPVRESACECERSQELQLGPIMALVSGPTIGQAISDPKCELPRLALTELSDGEMIREIYLRVLSRPATTTEVEAILSSANQIATDHQRLAEQLSEKETWWKNERARLEEIRIASLEETRRQITQREQDIAPQRERLEQDRVEKIAKAEQQLTEYAAHGQKIANDYLDRSNQHWFPLLPVALSASSKTQLAAQPDRSITAVGSAEKGKYTLQFHTPLERIRGIRLEALPQPGLEGGGPGLPKNGNFVLTEIEVSTGPTGKPKQQQRVKLRRAIADFSQDGFGPDQAIDGQLKDQRGWAVSPQGGVVHWAVFETEQPIDVAADHLLTVTLHQFHNAADHRLARFRISVTTDDGELSLGLPEEFAALKSIPADQRSLEQLAPLISYLERHDGKWNELRQAVAAAKQPLPVDSQLASLQAQAESLAQETPDDSKLLQLRRDFAASEQQNGNRRLTLAQDLTWALINSPAFLFNH